MFLLHNSKFYLEFKRNANYFTPDYNYPPVQGNSQVPGQKSSTQTRKTLKEEKEVDLKSQVDLGHLLPLARQILDNECRDN